MDWLWSESLIIVGCMEQGLPLFRSVHHRLKADPHSDLAKQHLEQVSRRPETVWTGHALVDGMGGLRVGTPLLLLDQKESWSESYLSLLQALSDEKGLLIMHDDTRSGLEDALCQHRHGGGQGGPGLMTAEQRVWLLNQRAQGDVLDAWTSLHLKYLEPQSLGEWISAYRPTVVVIDTRLRSPYAQLSTQQRKTQAEECVQRLAAVSALHRVPVVVRMRRYIKGLSAGLWLTEQ